jgi:hypothetical protein
MNRRNKIKSMKPINDKDLGKTEANIEATASEEMGLIILLQGRKKAQIWVGCQSRQSAYTICRAWHIRDIDHSSTVHRNWQHSGEASVAFSHNTLEIGWLHICL